MRIVTLFIIPFTLFSIDPSYLQGKTPAANLPSDVEANVNAQIKSLNLKISKYLVLTNLNLREFPANTVVRMQPQFVEVTSYNNSPNSKLFRSVSMKIFHKDGKYLSNEVVITDSNYYEVYFTVDIISDMAPMKDSDLTITSNFRGAVTRLRVDDIENNVILPSRLSLKRDFYIPVLQHFIGILQLTREYNYKREIKKENALLGEFTRSKRY